MAFSLCKNDLFEEYMLLQCRVKDQKRIIDEFESGARYIKIQQDHHRVVAGYIKEIERLKKELAEARIQAVKVRDIWTDECYEVWQDHQKEAGRKDERIYSLEDKVMELQQKYRDDMASMRFEYEEKIHEKDCVIQELTNRLAHDEALLGRDSTNTGLPTGMTLPGKKKHNPNSRKNSGKKKGGQPGHEKHDLKKPSEKEATEIIDHTTDKGAVCPVCRSEDLVYTGRYEEKWEYDISINVNRILHKYWLYKCADCGETVRCSIEPNLRADCQYGPKIQALALSLMNTANAPINKVAMFLNGITGGELRPCEGYIAKVQARSAKKLIQFRDDLKLELIRRGLVYWDDTVIFILTKRACLRFYGDETIAYYTAHEHKDMASIDEDNVLALLTKQTKVMHDHNTLNYNAKFLFINIECIQHLERDCQRNTDDTGHEWSKELKDLISSTIKDRKEAKERDETAFSEAYKKTFYEKVDKCIEKGWTENKAASKKYGADFERALLNRLVKYRKNYFLWVEDLTVPTTNNLSERGLRGVKSHMKISGQFESVKAADNYALVRTYIETCRRNGINEIHALDRLCAGDPYTVAEIFHKSQQ